MPIWPKPWLKTVAPCPHGGISSGELQALGLPSVLDFSTCLNPLGPCPQVVAAAREAPLHLYPEEGDELVAALARHLGVDHRSVILANGSVELLWLLGMAFLRSGDRVLVLDPTFGEYERACRIFGARVTKVTARAQDRFYPDLKLVTQRVRELSPRLVFLCNPNNPTGVYLERPDIEFLLEACSCSLLVVDEAYVNFVEQPSSLVPLLSEGNIFLLRSFTKDYAVPGLRLGYGLGDEKTVAALRRVRPPWSVGAAAQRAGLVALQCEEYLARGREVSCKAREYLTQALSDLGLKVYPSRANFLLIEVADAAAFRKALLRQGFCVRDCTSFGLPTCIRIGMKTLSECQALVKAIRKVTICSP